MFLSLRIKKHNKIKKNRHLEMIVYYALYYLFASTFYSIPQVYPDKDTFNLFFITFHHCFIYLRG